MLMTQGASPTRLHVVLLLLGKLGVVPLEKPFNVHGPYSAREEALLVLMDDEEEGRSDQLGDHRRVDPIYTISNANASRICNITTRLLLD